MAVYKLTERAKSDLIQIYKEGAIDFGTQQADKYLFELEQRFILLSQNVSLGRQADELSIGIRRFPYKAHSIFYSHASQGVLIVRILDQRMDFAQYLG